MSHDERTGTTGCRPEELYRQLYRSSSTHRRRPAARGPAAEELYRQLFRSSSQPSNRKLRLLSVANARSHWSELSKVSRDIVLTAEGYADSPAAEADRQNAWHVAYNESVARDWEHQQADESLAEACVQCDLGNWDSSTVEQAKVELQEAHNRLHAAMVAQVATAHDDWLLQDLSDYGSVGDVICCVFGDLLRPVACDPSWRTSTVVGLAEAIYAERAFDRLPILADALEEAGCTHPDVLAHCRGDGPHARGCWVVDLILGKS